MPISAGGDPADAGRLANIPAWVFHGLADPTVRIESAYQMVQAMRDVHARIRFTVYDDRGHNSWVPAYDDPRLYRWLLEQKRGDPAEQPSKITGIQPDEEFKVCRADQLFLPEINPDSDKPVPRASRP